MGAIEEVEKEFIKTDIPEISPGDTVTVNVKIKEGDKERVQGFEGIVLRTRGRSIQTTFTVRKISYGIGVERVFSLHSPSIDSIKVLTKGKKRRARLYFLRDLKGKAVKQKLRLKN